MNRCLLALFVLLFAALAVSAAPVDVNVFETRVTKPKAVTKAKAVAKPPIAAKSKAITKSKTVVKPKAVTKPKVAAQPPMVAKPKVAAIPTTPKAATKSKGSPKPATGAKKPATSCPVPARKPATRRFLEYVGLRTRSDPGDCLPSFDPSPPSSPIDEERAKEKEEKAARKKADQAAKAQQKADKDAAAEASEAAAEAAKRPVGVVTNLPTKNVRCVNRQGGLTEIPVESILEAVGLAQAGPLVVGDKFPHAFTNVKKGTTQEEVNVPAACKAPRTLEEHAVGVDMSTFKNEPAVLKTSDFNQFRVLIMTPDATGATIFCGVMTHGLSEVGAFDNALCAEV
ncbi:hypothetical protein FB451DRAFT_1412395 [Mycena latifolia]|nr:hypothetical protein FB451DRAFT_1188797 [Mycena latifolia]KAJ7446368.1 hypothetical protein FB451DRAFT_1412395 [Mycena latifolia]